MPLAIGWGIGLPPGSLQTCQHRQCARFQSSLPCVGHKPIGLGTQETRQPSREATVVQAASIADSVLVSSQATFKLLVACGAIGWLVQTKRIPNETGQILSKVSFLVCIPCMLLSQMAFTWHTYFSPSLLVIPLMAQLQLLVSRLLAELATLLVLTPQERRATGFGPRQMIQLAGTFGNSLTLPLMMLLSALPASSHPEVIAYLSIYLLGWSPVFWVVGPATLQTAVAGSRPETPAAEASGKGSIGKRSMEDPGATNGQRAENGASEAAAKGPSRVSGGTGVGAVEGLGVVSRNGASVAQNGALDGAMEAPSRDARVLEEMEAQSNKAVRARGAAASQLPRPHVPPGVRTFFSRVLSPPIFATLVGIAIAATPPVAHLLFDAPRVTATDFLAAGDVSWLTSARLAVSALLRTVVTTVWDLVKLIGGGTVALQVILLAATLGQRDDVSATSEAPAAGKSTPALQLAGAGGAGYGTRSPAAGADDISNGSNVPPSMTEGNGAGVAASWQLHTTSQGHLWESSRRGGSGEQRYGRGGAAVEQAPAVESATSASVITQPVEAPRQLQWSSPKVLLCIAVLRFLVVPTVCTAAYVAAEAAGILPSHLSPVARLAILVQCAMPPAQNLVTQMQVNDATKHLAKPFAKLLLWMCAVGVLPITAWVAVYVRVAGVVL